MTQQTIDMVRPIYATFQQTYGIPKEFWQDEFVLGFIGTMITMVSEVVSQRRLSQEDKGYLLVDTFSALSNLNGVAITRHFTDLILQQPQSDDFKRGGDNAEIVTLAFLGCPTRAARELVEEAKKTAFGDGTSVDGALVTPLLAVHFWMEPLKERFNLHDQST